MRVWHILQARLESLFFRDRREADLREELQFHLERETERLERTGMRPSAARLQALRTFGGVEPTTEACRDARGTALLDNVVRDVRYTFRSFRRSPLVALTIVTTVGLGLGLVAVVFTFLNAIIFRVDEVRNPHELFTVERQQSANAEPETFTRPQYETLVRETGVFSDAFATTGDVESRIEGRRMEGHLVTGNFFQVLGVGAARGRTLTPSDDGPGGLSVIVLSHPAWSRHFASDPDILGRTVLVNGATFSVVGVMPEGFRGLETVAPPDFWAPLSLRGQFRRSQEGEDSAGLHIVGRLKPGLSRGQALAQLLVWDSRRAAEDFAERPAPKLVLEPKTGTAPMSADSLLLFMPLFFAFGLILLIGCANVANLLLARGVARQREIGIRLAIGASRRRVIRQLLTESLLLALVSAALAFGISRFVLAGVVYAVTSTFPPDLGNLRLVVPPADWRVALFLVAGAMASTMFFALAPALQATRFDLVRAVRGEVMRDRRPGRARNVLVALQVTASALLLICAAVFLRSALAAATIDPGFRAEDIVMVGIANEQARSAVLDAVTNDPSVAVVAASWPGELNSSPPAVADTGNGKSTVAYKFVSPEYFNVLGIDVVRGRGFAQTERSASAAVAVVSESAARQLWPALDAVGQALRLEPEPRALSGAEGMSATRRPDDPPLPSRTFDVVGIARDVPGFKFVSSNQAVVYVPIGADAARTLLTVRVHGDPELVRTGLVEKLAAIEPNIGEIFTLQLVTRMASYFLQLGFWLTLVLGALALLLTLSGLFSVLSYLVEQRTREIGVRMALGATSPGIGALVLWQSARPVGIGLLLGGSLTVALGAVLMATPAAAQIGSVVRLFDPVAYTASLLCIVTACACASLIPALRAGRIDPIAALRQD